MNRKIFNCEKICLGLENLRRAASNPALLGPRGPAGSSALFGSSWLQAKPSAHAVSAGFHTTIYIAKEGYRLDCQKVCCFERALFGTPVDSFYGSASVGPWY